MPNNVSESGRVKRTIFTEDMKKDYTILVPDMLPMHFKLIIKIYEKHGYTVFTTLKPCLLKHKFLMIADLVITGLNYVLVSFSLFNK